MKKLGKILHVSAQNRIIVRSEKNISATNSAVINKELKRIGKIFDIFGSTKKPYVAVVPHKPSILKEVQEGEILYLRDDKSSKKRPYQSKTTKHKTRRKRFDRNNTKPT